MDMLIRFASLNKKEKTLICEALLLLVLTRLSIRAISFDRIIRILNSDYWKRKRFSESENSLSESDIIERSVSRAVKVLNWENICLVQAITKFIMFRRRGIHAVICAGVKVLDDSSLAAHAWIRRGCSRAENASCFEFTIVLRIGE